MCTSAAITRFTSSNSSFRGPAVSSPKRVKQRAGTCIFCDGTGLSKEHIWSDWLDQVLPKAAYRYEAYYAGGRDVDGDVKSIAPRRRQGSVQTKKFRGVCERCNNEWMSKIVDDAKPYATKLIKGEPIVLTMKAQSALASWLSLSAMMANRLAKLRHKFPASDLAHMFEHHTAPAHWRIDIGLYAEPDQVEFNNSHFAFILADTKTNEIASEFVVHAIATTLGHLYVIVYCAEPVDHRLARIVPANIHRPHLVPIWPSIGHISFPRPPELTITGPLLPGGVAYEIATRLQRWMRFTFGRAGFLPKG